MACSCHGRRGIAVTKTAPYDQCTTCAKKHVVKAWNLFNEFTYTDDNRDVISGQLRNAADHLMYDHKGIALKARDLAVIIEEAKDKELTNEWPDLLSAVRQVYYADHSDVADRLGQLEDEHKQSLEEQMEEQLKESREVVG